MENSENKPGIGCIGVFVVFVCHDGEGNFLLSKRSVNTRDEHGLWGFGGGGVEFGERVIDALHRELMEEYGVEALELQMLGHRDCVRRTPDEHGVASHRLVFDFLVKVDRTKVRVCEPHMVDDMGWFRLDALPTPLQSGVRPVVHGYDPASRVSDAAT